MVAEIGSGREQWFPAHACRRTLLPEVDGLCASMAGICSTEQGATHAMSMDGPCSSIETMEASTSLHRSETMSVESSTASGGDSPGSHLPPPSGLPLPRPPPRSCDTFCFVAGPGGPAATLFAKNSDRPSDEEHEVVAFPAAEHEHGSLVRCTHTSIPRRCALP